MTAGQAPPEAPFPSRSPWAEDGTVEVEVAGGVATVSLNRPPGNGWTPGLGREFFAALDRLAADPEVRALVVTGAGPDFCVGADGGSLDNITNAGSYEIDAARPTYWTAMTIAKPVVAAVNGACFGVGLQLALFCDVRFAGSSAKFATAFVRRGLIAELGMTWLLPRIVGLGVANDLLLSGRLVRAAEAERLGLVNRVVEDTGLLAAAQEYAAGLAARCSPAAMGVVKRQTYTDLTSTLPAAVARGDAYLEAALASADFAEGVRSWRERRPPVFGGLDPAHARFTLPDADDARQAASR
ncbi:Enoyl-CoA hydratase/carnithine racemase [Parafrankia irregularis]|uniref:Enoyl-CoA hydratase/carnithine racemase n=1 Tax=Parafrankia irregularis TaxID=795642 RepID=A0A0S4QSG8_9ACTN|nr:MULTISPECIES: enoyl-CoA hydratase-related protein [Parafrankia]MBE3202777.1 enoyl-CoA hydratase/isomerase family protein [Parafrankia sp. CH37]CUU57970.1 Enoyl-CoA hydratase/carnithine racemase [Parafrankia irregularis]